MGNHYHLVLRTKDIGLWRSMARLQGTVARSFNRRRRLHGRLWQSRYRARVIDSEDYFRQAVAYVHLNPVAAGLVADPAEYALSGHREITGRCRAHLVDRHAVLASFGSEHDPNPAEAYLRWVRAVAEARSAAEGVAELPWWAEAGDVDEIADAERSPSATTFDGRELAEERRALELGELVSRMESLGNLTLAELTSRSRGLDETRARIELCTLAIGRYGLRVRDVASLLRKHPNSVTKWLNRGLRLERDDPEFRRRLDRLDAALSRRA